MCLVSCQIHSYVPEKTTTTGQNVLLFILPLFIWWINRPIWCITTFSPHLSLQRAYSHTDIWHSIPTETLERWRHQASSSGNKSSAFHLSFHQQWCVESLSDREAWHDTDERGHPNRHEKNSIERPSLSSKIKCPVTVSSRPLWQSMCVLNARGKDMKN